MNKTKLKSFACLTVSLSILTILLLPNVTRSQQSPATGDPLPGLTTEELALFYDGQEAFEQVHDIESGLGPIFNGRSCAECHSIPASGGASAITVLRAAAWPNGIFDPLENVGGNVIQLAAISPNCQERIPDAATVIARRLTTPVFGAGLIEAIPDASIVATAAQRRGGFEGRVHWVRDEATGQMRVGRFGWKSQHATLLAFSGEALQGEMGVTNRLFPHENAPNGDLTRLAECDQVTDPEDQPDANSGLSNIDRSANFMRFLGPPARGPITSDVIEGERIFNRSLCEDCHTPTYTTGPSPIAALNRKTVNAFSDFLLHDVGPEGADHIVQGDARGNEMRTTPLWGLRDRSPHLRDGTAVTIEQSILLGHFGEATRSRQRFENLSRADKDKMLAFLKSL